MTARDDVLARIAAAHVSAPPADLPYEAVARDYRTTSELDAAALTVRLVDRLLDYKALVRQCSPIELPTVLAQALSERGARSIVVPAGLAEGWLAEVPDGLLRVDGIEPTDQLSVAELDQTDGVLTSCAVAVAETGTLVLDGSAGQGRRLVSLIPDYHLCVVLPAQVVADVPQLVARLDITRPTTMISGPSATSDIELNRVEGVHGPRTLEVIVVGP